MIKLSLSRIARNPLIVDVMFCAVGLVITLIPYLTVLADSNQALLYRDLTDTELPLKHVWLQGILNAGHVPHWNHYHLAGTPYLANVNPGPLFPLNWVFYLLHGLGTTRALVYYIVSHHLLIFIGSFFLFRDLKVRRGLALVGGLSLTLGGFAMSSDNLLHILGAQIGVPFLFLFWRRALRRNRAGPDLFLASLALICPIYAGDPQYTFVALIVLGASLFSGKRTQRKLLYFALLVFLGVLASAPQLLPTLAFIKETSRGFGSLSIPELLVWSMHPARFLEILFPLPFGNSPDLKEYWGYIFLNSLPRKHPFIFSIYPGLLVGLFLLTYLSFLGKANRLKKSFFGLLIFSLGCMLAAGDYAPIPIYELLARYFPFWSSFRHPERLAYWPVFLWTVAGTLAGEKIFRLLQLRRKIEVRAVAAVLLISCGVFLFFLGRHSSTVNAVVSTAALGIGILYFLWRAPPPGRTWGPVNCLVCMLAVLDLAFFSSKLVWKKPVSFAQIDSYPWISELVRLKNDRDLQIKSGEGTRFFSSSKGQLAWQYADKNWGSMEHDLFYVWGVLKPNTAALWGIEDIRGHFGLFPLTMPNLYSEFTDGHWSRLLDLLSVRYQMELKNGRPTISVNADALPFVSMRAQTLFVDTRESAITKLKSEDWNLHENLLLESVSPENRLQRVNSGIGWRIEKVSRKFDEIEVTVIPDSQRSQEHFWLLLNEGFHANWRAHFLEDDSPLPILRANAWSMAVALPPATPTKKSAVVRFTYFDPWYSRGFIAAYIWLFFLLSMLYWSRTKEEKVPNYR